jgi:CBS domain-containing protein/anti-sigma regulatory factor (Ser/Thr protein kinase)
MNTAPEARRAVTDEEATRISRVEELSYELTIAQVMATNIVTLRPDMTMAEALDVFHLERISGAPVVENGQMIGIVSIEDMIRALRRGNSQAHVRTYMTPAVFTIHDYDPVVEALRIFSKTHVGRLPVVDVHDRLVGVLTKGDITSGTLRALQSDYQAEEIRRYRASHLFEDIVSDRTSLVLRYTIKPNDFSRGGKASSYIKRALLRLGANAQLARRCAIAVYEAEINLIIHATNGGILRVQIEPNQIFMSATDDGPGIPDVDLARKPGYSTASEHVREMGFGAGMGLRNIERCVDEMSLDSTVGKGTRLEMKIFLLPEESFREVNQYQQTQGAAA